MPKYQHSLTYRTSIALIHGVPNDKSNSNNPHSSDLEMGHGVPLLGVDKGREEDGVPDEEDGGVVPYQVPVTLLGIELHREPTGVPGHL